MRTNLQTATKTNPDGWQGTVGAAEVEIEGSRSYAVLSVFSGFGKAVGVLAIFNDQSYVTQLDAFTQGIKLDKTKAVALTNPSVPNNQSTPSTNSSSSSTTTHSTPTIATTPVPLSTAVTQTTDSGQVALDTLNDFVEKGLPVSAAVPTDNLDQAAVRMAQQITKSDEHSLSVLLAALQTAGFSIIDERGKVLRAPSGDGKGQGLGIYDFEVVGSLKLDNRGVSISLEKIAGTITKDTPQISSAQFAELMLKELRAHAVNADNAYLRFWARLIIELGKSSAHPVDLMTASLSKVKLSMLQTTLLIRRVQGDLSALQTLPKDIGMIPPPFSQRHVFVSPLWKMDDVPRIHLVFDSSIPTPACHITGDDALILDGAANVLGLGQGWWMGLLEKSNVAGMGTTLGKLSNGLAITNMVLAWGKLVAAVTMLKGEIIVETPLPLVRTKNSVPGDKRLMTARIWSEVGKKELLNCLRPAINIATGLDFDLPVDGPVGDTAIEWHFAGENETRVNNAGTRNLKKFVVFESPLGKNRDPEKQLTDNNGISQMLLVGAAKIPAVAYQKNPKKVTKTAHVLVGVTLKSSKDFAQNLIDIGGSIAGIGIGAATGGPLGFALGVGGAAAEILFRLPYVAARATIPVTDHDPFTAYSPITKFPALVLSGVICSLEEPFSIKGTMTRSFNNLVIYYKFVPTSAKGGAWIGNLSATHTTGATAVVGGGGSYTIKGADTDKPLVMIEGQGQGTGHVTSPKGDRYNGSRSISGLMGQFDLVPIETDECNKP